MANGKKNKKDKSKKKIERLEARWERQKSRGSYYKDPNWTSGEQMSKRDIRNYKRVRKIKDKAKGTPNESKVLKKYDYDHKYADKIGVKPDATGHRQSLDPKTGRILKGIKHPTIYKTRKTDRALGYKHKKIDGEWYSVPKRKPKLRSNSNIKGYKTNSGKKIYKRSGSRFNGTL